MFTLTHYHEGEVVLAIEVVSRAQVQAILDEGPRRARGGILVLEAPDGTRDTWLSWHAQPRPVWVPKRAVLA